MPAPEGPPAVVESRKPRVCIVTTEFHGLFKNGGIGTANTGLALALARADFDVTVAFADADENGPRVKNTNFFGLREEYRALGITLDFVPASHLIAHAFDDSRSASYCVYLYLKQHPFDVVYFNDSGGHGYYSLLAKRTGVFHNAPRMLLVAHGPQEWVLELNSVHYTSRWPVITAFMERRCAELADVLISPSRYLADWMVSHGWVMPAQVLVIQNIVQLPDAMVPLSRSLESARITEIVFFGRLEVRKGLELFCDAVDLLHRLVNLSGVRITFMGKFSHVAGLHSGMYVVERARRWRSSLRILGTYAQEDALDYLNTPGVLAVVPSLAENSPCAVAECLQLGVPFVATNSGGTAELVAPGDRDVCLVAPESGVLAATLNRILNSGHSPARLAVPQDESRAKWLELTRQAALDRARTASTTPAPLLVSICLVQNQSPATQALLESILGQTYPRLEVVLFDDGGFTPSAFAPAGERIAVRILSARPSDRGAARNAAAAQARGSYLLFVEEDATVLMPECVEIFMTAALRTGAGIVTGVPLEFSNSGRPPAQRDGRLGYFPIGACAELGGFENCFGFGALLIERRVFEEGGRFAAPCDPAIEDWLFLATSVLSGTRLEVVPEPLFWYRVRRPLDLLRSSAVDHQRRILDAYCGHEIRIFRHILETMVDVDLASRKKLREVLARIGGAAGETAFRVSSTMEPNSTEALRGFVRFCIERNKVQEAFEFARDNGRSLLSDAVGWATQFAEKLALDAVRSQADDLSHEVDLTGDVRQRVKSVAAVAARDLVRPAGAAAEHTIDFGVTILKASAICPPGTRSVQVVVAASLLPAALAIALSPAGASLGISGEDIESSGPFWWSGWHPVGEESTTLELSVQVPDPIDRLLNLYLLAKTGETNPDPEGKITWKSVAATISVHVAIAAASQVSLAATPISREVLAGGVLLTAHPDFPFPVFVPGDPTLLHPLPGRPVIARLVGAAPPGTRGVMSVVSIERAEAHPVQFAVWISPSSTAATSEADFTAKDAFSGWFLVPNPLERYHFTVNLRTPATETMDLYIATRVVGYTDVHYCHAVWHELLILD